LLRRRLLTVEQEGQERDGQLRDRQQALERARTRRAETAQQMAEQGQVVLDLESQYQDKQRPERPYSALAKAREKLAVLERRHGRLDKTIPDLEKQVAVRQNQLLSSQADVKRLQQRLAQFEAENAANRCPIEAIFRLDAGFGTRENVALLIELGYEVYVKPYSDWLTPRLKRQVDETTIWQRVGQNAEMVAWKAMQLSDFPYPLDVALERFYTGATQRYGTLLHFGNDPVHDDLPGWFRSYNARQIIEAGIEEGKNVFEMHHLKVRSAPALDLQEQFAGFGANFVRWAARWLMEQCPQLPAGWQDTTQPRVKEQVRVAAHTSAWVNWQAQGCLLMFTDYSVFAGRSLELTQPWTLQLPLPFSENALF
jgi:uncharacterized coiled-coil protein SlyX